MRDDDRGAIAHHALDGALDELLGLGVDRARRFVEDQIAGSKARARANEINCFCPTDKPAPRSRTSDSYSPFKRTNKTVGVNFLRGPAHALLRDVLAPRRMLPSIVPLNRKHFLKHDGEVLPQRPQVPLAHIHAVEQNPPALDVVEAHEQVRDRRLPGTRVTDERDRLPGSTVNDTSFNTQSSSL